ncbi:MAG TPA: chemotaxis protein [Candidatus Eisenbacteria bacterium]|nr:chemotaxis protein [Candidatus Eisenbacteria bacterium]
MAHKLAIAFIHGIGRTERGYSIPMQRALARCFSEGIRRAAPDPAAELVFEEVDWGVALQADEDRLWRRMRRAASMRWGRLRKFMVNFAADAIAYQPAPSDRTAYDGIHCQVAESLARLAERAGPRAPLCIISHSLGTVIASNYVYDLAKRRNSFLSQTVRERINGTPLERGETLALFYTMGSPIALWSLRYPSFGRPIRFPHQLAAHHPGLAPRWVNFYDPDDVIGYALKPLNASYDAVVTEDCVVDVGSLLTRWTPFSHMGYWSDKKVAAEIADGLVAAWRTSSALALVPKPGRRVPSMRKRVRTKV